MRVHDLLDGLDVAGARRTDAGVFEIRGASDVPDAGAVDVQSVEHDSRAVRPGALFCCIPGSHTDGHDHAAEAIAAGAVACLVERALPLDVTQIRVGSVRRAVGPIAARFYGEPSRSMRVLGVTGTNGKTTVTYLLEQIARANGERTGLIGTTGVHIGGDVLPVARTTPEATELQALLATMRDEGSDVVAMEVSSHALAQYRVDGTHFAVACFTNLSHDHLDYHGTLEEYFDAKARLFSPAFAARAAICIDTDAGRRLVKRARNAGVQVSTYASSAGAGADVGARDIRLEPAGTSFTLLYDGAQFEVNTPLLGLFNVANVLGAIAAARLDGTPLSRIINALAEPMVIPGRMERVDAGQPFTVLVDYAHTPDALVAALSAARSIGDDDARLIVVFGCGGDRDRAKRPVMGNVATARGDVVILTSDNPRGEDPEAIVKDVLSGVPADAQPPIVELDRRRAIRAAFDAARPGDVVLIAGKGHESGQTALGVTVPFDDRSVAREQLGAPA